MKQVMVVCLLLSLILACSEDFAKPESQHPFVIKENPIDGYAPFEGEDPSANVKINSTVLLAGPYLEGGRMHTALNDAGLLPKQQPYGAGPFWYDGDESLESMPREIVDWILIGLLDPVTLATVARRAALLTESGEIVDLDGRSPVAFKALPDYYIVALYHRNHLAIMSDVSVDITSGSGVYDFTKGNAGSQEIEPGIYAMVQGDVNGDQLVKFNGSQNDKNAVLQAVGTRTPNKILAAYHVADVNMDGIVKFNGAFNDKQAILETVGILTPSNIVVGQLFE